MQRMAQAERDSPGGSLIDIAVSTEGQVKNRSNVDPFGFVLLETGTAEMTPSEALAANVSQYIAFVQSKPTLFANVESWMKNLYFAPSDLASSSQKQAPDALFVPFYLFTIQTKSICTAVLPAPRSDQSQSENTTPPTQIEKTFSQAYPDVLTCASYLLNPDLLRTLIMPNAKGGRVFPANGVQQFKSDSIREGERILSIDIDARDAWKTKETTLKSDLEPARCTAELLKEFPAAVDIDVAVEIVSMDHFTILLPFYHVVYSYAGNDYELLMSGWRGQVDGTRPYGWGTAGKIVNSVYTVVKDTI